MTVQTVAAERARARHALTRKVALSAGKEWRRLNPANLSGSWAPIGARLLVLVTAAQIASAAGADSYVDDALAAQDLADDSAGRVNTRAFGGVASDGRDLATLLFEPAIAAMEAMAHGVAQDTAMDVGLARLLRIVGQQIPDAGRVADGVAVTARPRAGYVRMIVGKTCSRCIQLAGKWYRWNTGFDRHPHCDCIHIPASEDTGEDLRTDPKRLFASMSEAEQDRVFTKAGAQAIRDGADLNQVVNARRGAAGLAPAGRRLTNEEIAALRSGRLQATDVYGRQLYVTTEGTTTRGVAGSRLGARETGRKTKGNRYRRAQTPRLMPESIYQIAGDDRAEAQRLLKRFGYIL